MRAAFLCVCLAIRVLRRQDGSETLVLTNGILPSGNSSGLGLLAANITNIRENSSASVKFPVIVNGPHGNSLAAAAIAGVLTSDVLFHQRSPVHKWDGDHMIAEDFKDNKVLGPPTEVDQETSEEASAKVTAIGWTTALFAIIICLSCVGLAVCATYGVREISGISSFMDQMRVFINGPRQLHLALFLTFLDAIRFFCGVSTLPLLLTNEFGFSDYRASLVTANSVIVCLFFGFMGSYLIDKYDAVANVSRIGCTLSFISRIALVFTSGVHGETVVLCMTLLVFPLVEGCLGPGFRTAVVRLSTNETRSFNFALVYAVNSLGGAVGFAMVDFIKDDIYHIGPYTLSGIRFSFLVTGIVMFVAAVLTIFMRDDRLELTLPQIEAASRCATWTSKLKTLFSLRATWKVLAFSLVTTFTCMQWQFCEVLLPKYLTRIHGTGVPWGSISSVNLWGCVVGPPIAAALFSDYDDFDVIVPGLIIFAISPLFMVFSNSSIKGSLVWLSSMTIGEIVWSPRFQAFSASLCPPNQQAMFLTLVSMPRVMFSWIGLMASGLLLERFVPACNQCMDQFGYFCDVSTPTGCQSSTSGNHCPSLANSSVCGKTCGECPHWAHEADLMWLTVLCVSLISPLLVVSFRGFFASQSPAERMKVARQMQRGVQC